MFLANAICLITEGIEQVEAVRSVIAIATNPLSDPLGLVVDPSLTKCQGQFWTLCFEGCICLFIYL